MRAGDWKLVAEHGKPWELYTSPLIVSEQNNLSQKHPERVEQLSKLWEAYAKRANVEAWDAVMPKQTLARKKKAKDSKKVS